MTEPSDATAHPFHDPELDAAVATQGPLSAEIARRLIDRGRTKAVLRDALADLLPEKVRERRDKLGFVTPEKRWFRGRLGDLAGDVFASRAFADRGLVDAAAARRRLDRHRRGEVDAGMELWRALNTELWARAFLD